MTSAVIPWVIEEERSNYSLQRNIQRKEYCGSLCDGEGCMEDRVVMI